MCHNHRYSSNSLGGGETVKKKGTFCTLPKVASCERTHDNFFLGLSICHESNIPSQVVWFSQSNGVSSIRIALGTFVLLFSQLYTVV